MRLTCRLQIPCDERLRPRLKSRRISDLASVLDVVAVVIDRRHVIRSPLRHLHNRCVVQVRCMLQRIRSCAHRVARTIRPVGMNRNLLPKLMRRVHRRFNLVITVGLKSTCVVICTGGRKQFDQVHSRRHLLPHHAQHFRHAIRNSPRRVRPWRRICRLPVRSSGLHELCRVLVV